MSPTTEAPTFAPPAKRATLRTVVPMDYFRPVRLFLMISYLVGYLIWLKTKGLTVDRISVAIAVGIFLVCAFVGKTWRTWGVLLLDCIFYCAMWLAYEKTRGAADDGVSVFGLFRIKFPTQVESTRNIDRAMFFGNDPNVVLQEHFWSPVIRWWDVVAGATYMTHFVFPMIAMGVLWATSHRQWLRFIRRFATLLAVGCVMFVVLPTAPPWMLGDARYPYQLLPPLQRTAGRGFYHIGFGSFRDGYKVALSNGNAVAAMPSLHASFALIVPLFFMQWIRRTWIKALLFLFPIMMLASLVYLGEHWVIDGLVGWAVTFAAFWFWNRMEQRARTRRSAAARGALPALADDPEPAIGPAATVSTAEVAP